MRYFIFVVIFVANSYSYAQEVMMDVKMEKDTVFSKKGPNMKSFSHLYVGFGFKLSGVEGDSLSINYGKSNEFIFGYRYKYKINRFYALGGDLFYSFSNTNIAQTNNKKFATGVNHKKERYCEKNIGFIFYNRFNFGKRGNKIGNFIDLGAYVETPFNNTLITIDKINATNFNQVKIIRKNLTFYTPYNYGVNFRAGINQIILFANYRLSNQFKPNFKYAELPRLTVGFQIGMHQ